MRTLSSFLPNNSSKYRWDSKQDSTCITTTSCTKKCPDGYAEGPYQCYYSNPHSGMGTCHCTHQNLPVEDTPSTQSECTAQSNGYGGRVCSWTANACPSGGTYISGYCYYYHDFLC